LPGSASSTTRSWERGDLSGVSDSVLEALARALQLDEAEHAHLLDLARAAGPAARTRRRTPAQQVRPTIQRLLDLMTEVPVIVNNARLDLVASNPLGQALFAPVFASPRRPANQPVNHARFTFLDPRAHDFWIDWERAADDSVAQLRTEAGRDLHLNFEVMELPADPGLSLLAFSADAGSPGDDALNLLASWAATHDPPMLSSHPPGPERGIYAEEVNQLANGTVRRLILGLPARVTLCDQHEKVSKIIALFAWIAWPHGSQDHHGSRKLTTLRVTRGLLCYPDRKSCCRSRDNADMTLEELYKDLHSHPELAFAEHRTSGIAAEWLAGAGYTVSTGIGGTGVAGVLRNGDGPAVLVRGDMDALPLREETGLDYASDVVAVDARGERTHVMHACGHDMHVACLCGATAELAATTDTWQGTLIAVFQPAEEIGAGAKAMLDDGLFDKAGVPDLVLGQHVFAQAPGSVLYRSGPFLAAAESWDVTFYGQGGHGSRPQDAVDPVVMAASAVLRLQTLVAREIAPADKGVVTVSRLRAGHAENVIPDTATITLNFRAYDPDVQRKLTEGARRIIDAEASASGALRQPEYTMLASFPVTVNDSALTARLAAALDRTREIEPRMGSEDFGLFGMAAGVPSFLWDLGCAADGSPGNHSPRFAPQIDPTLPAGVKALVTAVRNVLPVA